MREFDFERFGMSGRERWPDVMRDYDKDVMRRVREVMSVKIDIHRQHYCHLTKSDVRDIVDARVGEHAELNGHLSESDVRDIVREEIKNHTKGEWHTPQFADTTKPDAEPQGMPERTQGAYVEPGDVVKYEGPLPDNYLIITRASYEHLAGKPCPEGEIPLYNLREHIADHVTRMNSWRTLDNQPVRGVREEGSAADGTVLGVR